MGLLAFSRRLALAAMVAAPFAWTPPVMAYSRQVAQAYEQIVQRFGSQMGLQLRYEAACSEMGHINAAIAMDWNVAKAFRDNGRHDLAGPIQRTADELKKVYDHAADVVYRLEVLDTPLDEARGRSAFNASIAQTRSLLEKTPAEQFEHGRTRTLETKNLIAIATAAEQILAVHQKHPR
jgi:hypothetical protein